MRRLAAAAALFVLAACTPQQLAALTSASPTALAVPSTTVAPTATAAPTTAAPTATAAPTTAAPSATPTAAATTAAPTATPAPTPVPTPVPTAAPTATPAPTPVPTPTATPSPTPSPTPTGTPVPYAGYLFVTNASGPVAPSFTRYGATVVDAVTGKPVVGACAYTGPPAGCPPKGANHTDANGYFAVDLPTGITFAFTIEHPAYHALLSQLITGGASVTLRMTPN